MSIFVIINEWTDIADASGSEIVGGVYFEDENKAWVALAALAESKEVRIYVDETSFTLEDASPGITYDEYYIQELVKSA